MVRKVSKRNYRQFYKEYYGIEFGNEFEIHHIDKNRDNNNIGNLLLLPKKIHKQFHFIDSIKDNIKISLFDICIDSYYKELLKTIDFNNLRYNINLWYELKTSIDYYIYMKVYSKEKISLIYQSRIDSLDYK